MRTRTRILILAAAAALAASAASCGGGDSDEAAPEGAATAAETGAADTGAAPADESAAAPADAQSYELVIGDIVSLTGAENVFGPSFQAAADLAHEKINEAIESNGLDIEVRLEHADDETTPQGAVSAARALIASDASCIVGPLTSSSTIAVAESVTVPEGIPNIAVAASSIEITDLEDEGLVYRLFPSDALQAPALARVIAEDIGADATLSLAARNDAFGEGFMEVFKQAWEEQGGTALGPVLYDPEAASLDSEAQQIVRGDPDAFVVLDFPATYAKIGAALVRTGAFSGQDVYVAGGQPATIPDEVPFESMEGAVGTRPGVPESESFQAFLDLYEADADAPPLESFAQNNFDAVVLCFLASLAAGSSDPAEITASLQEVSGPPGTKYTWEQLPEAVAALVAGEDIDYEGVSGAIDFDENGDPSSAVYDVYKYIDGKQTVIGSYDTTTGELTITDPEAAGFGGGS